ncbi:PspC domain-containing protein [Sporosarcina trichiuri]|uniref:PspC domain-containing protein n=1 Tax=Sporosarcina trichiuri TaxID=3056445 RepID=UPI0025B376BC|nr:PspC domain-containing protein [Sporosarcina sp. 0.2-SM1T-5]WJY28142.1 PspC domain-containing protein [Sporosarcina sp. 0.2-SM1T-5]
MPQKLRRSTEDKVLSGVAGGIAHYLGISPFGVRLLFFVIPGSLLIYFILAFTIPEEGRL